MLSQITYLLISWLKKQRLQIQKGFWQRHLHRLGCNKSFQCKPFNFKWIFDHVNKKWSTSTIPFFANDHGNQIISCCETDNLSTTFQTIFNRTQNSSSQHHLLICCYCPNATFLLTPIRHSSYCIEMFDITQQHCATLK